MVVRDGIDRWCIRPFWKSTSTAGLWGKSGQRSLARSALVEAAGQLTRALGQIAPLSATPASRREQIKLQVALITPLVHVKGYAAPETQAAVERARLLIEQAEALGEPPEDPLLLFSVLYDFWVELCGVQRRCNAQPCNAVPGARRQARGDSLVDDRASPHGYFLGMDGKHRGRSSALRSGRCALRSCRASAAGDAIWSRRSGVNLVLSVARPVVARLSRRRAHRLGPSAQGRARVPVGPTARASDYCWFDIPKTSRYRGNCDADSPPALARSPAIAFR
jgi:hypothetical protein